MKVQDLIAYQTGFKLAIDVYEISKPFPKEETYSLTDQIRRSSRNVCINLSEAYRKRRSPKHIINKLTDCDAENGETQTWLEYAVACKYISSEKFELLNEESLDDAKLLNYMILDPEKFGSKKEY